MTQEEIDLIYNYLHENYEYSKGEFIRKKDSRAHKKGSPVKGQLNFSDKQTIVLCMSLSVFKTPNTPYAKLIFLYHHKIYPKYLKFLDKNPMNCNIENLMQSHKQLKSVEFKKFYKVLTKNGVRYRVCILLKNQYLSLGQHLNKDDAILIYDAALELFNGGIQDGNHIKEILKNKFPDFKLVIGNKTGFKCVYEQDKKFRYEFSHNKKRIGKSGFSTPKEAYEAYLKVKEELNK